MNMSLRTPLVLALLLYPSVSWSEQKSRTDRLVDGAVTRASVLLKEDPNSEQGEQLVQFALGLRPKHRGALLVQGLLQSGQEIEATPNAVADADYVGLLRESADSLRKSRKRDSELLCCAIALIVEPKCEWALIRSTAAENSGRDVSANSLLTKVFRKQEDKRPDSDKYDLCQILVAPNFKVSVQKLDAGVDRLSGRYTAPFSGIAPELKGAEFIRVPWQSSPKLKVRIMRSGYLYTIRIGKEQFGELASQLESVGGDLSGPHVSAARLKVSQGTVLQLSGHEVSLVAKKIVPHK